MEIVIGNLITSGSFAVREEEMTQFAIKKIATVGGRGERPVLVTPEDIVGMLRCATLLAEMPVRTRRYRSRAIGLGRIGGGADGGDPADI
jgi:hypothetical protein